MDHDSNEDADKEIFKEYEKLVLAFSSGTISNENLKLIFKKLKKAQNDKEPLTVGFNDYIERLILDSPFKKTNLYLEND